MQCMPPCAWADSIICSLTVQFMLKRLLGLMYGRALASGRDWCAGKRYRGRAQAARTGDALFWGFLGVFMGFFVRV